MYSAKVLGNGGNGSLSINQSKHKAALKQAVKTKSHLPHGAKKK